MSDKNKEQESIEGVMENHTEVDKSKRKFSKAGMAAPVIMTLASKPVFAVQGLSNMISGNVSDPQMARGNCYSGGFSHGRWKTGNHQNEWEGADLEGFITGTGQDITYTGTKVNSSSAFGGHTYPADYGDLTLIEVLNSESTIEIEFIKRVQGLLNIKYFKSSYFISETQFWEMNDIPVQLEVPNGYTLGGIITAYEDIDIVPPVCTP